MTQVNPYKTPGATEPDLQNEDSPIELPAPLDVITHPLLLLLANAINVVLWMPFGMGYYGWRWEAAAMRWLIESFVLAFVAISLLGCIVGWWPRIRPGRLVVSVPSLVLSLWGALVLRSWFIVYVAPMVLKR